MPARVGKLSRFVAALDFAAASYKIASDVLQMTTNASNGRPLLGAHMSIAGGVAESIGRGKSIGCDCIQIFTKSSRQWKSKPYSAEEIAAFKRNLKDSGIGCVIAHDSYLVNLGAPDEVLRQKSIAGFIDELQRCEALGVPWLVAHPGSHVGSGEEAGVKMIAKSIDEAHQVCAGFKVKVALEITAGQGSNLGYSFQQMGQIFDATKENDRLRLCFDTEHAFAAGYDISNEEGYQRTFTELDEHIGIERIVAFHLNDSLKPFHSKIDRHEHIGKGFLGAETFRRLLHDPRFFGIPMCLETEPGPEMIDIAADLVTLRGLL
ncbi:MAG TPA: deoxyribonuclease IV [Candidatus Binataceae bacterium]|nr:deoxyribonuclease IV [Candidatus Binataceae bacterium]